MSESTNGDESLVEIAVVMVGPYAGAFVTKAGAQRVEPGESAPILSMLALFMEVPEIAAAFRDLSAMLGQHLADNYPGQTGYGDAPPSRH